MSPFAMLSTKLPQGVCVHGISYEAIEDVKWTLVSVCVCVGVDVGVGGGGV